MIYIFDISGIVVAIGVVIVILIYGISTGLGDMCVAVTEFIETYAGTIGFVCGLIVLAIVLYAVLSERRSIGGSIFTAIGVTVISSQFLFGIIHDFYVIIEQNCNSSGFGDLIHLLIQLVIYLVIQGIIALVTGFVSLLMCEEDNSIWIIASIILGAIGWAFHIICSW